MRAVVALIFTLLGIVIAHPAVAQDALGMTPDDAIAVSISCGVHRAVMFPTYLIRRDSSGYTSELISTDSKGLKWSPDGMSLLWHKSNGLYVTNYANRETTRLTASHVINAVWSPSSQLIASIQVIQGRYAIWVMNKDGSNLRAIATPTSNTYRRDSISWSQDDQKIAYIAEDGLLTIIDVNTEEITYRLEGYQAAQPAWSPDGQVIAFFGDPNPDPYDQLDHVMYYRIGDSQPTIIHPFVVPSTSQFILWSNDSQSISYTLFENDTRTLYTVSIDGSSTQASVTPTSSIINLQDIDSTLVEIMNISAPIVSVVRRPQQDTTSLLQVGIQATVNVRDDGLSLRAAAGVGGELLAKMPTGTVVTIIGEPLQADNYTWWNVETGDGIQGWAVEAADGIQTLVPTASATIPYGSITLDCPAETIQPQTTTTPSPPPTDYAMAELDVIAVTLDCTTTHPIYFIRRGSEGYTAELFAEDGGTQLQWSAGAEHFSWVNEQGIFIEAIDTQEQWQIPAANIVNSKWGNVDKIFAYHQRASDGALTLWVTDSTGQNARQIASTHPKRSGFSFSEDDSQIAYINLAGHLTIANVSDGEVLRVIESHQATQPSWSPEGMGLVFMSYEPDGSLSHLVEQVLGTGDEFDDETNFLADTPPIDSEGQKALDEAYEFGEETVSFMDAPPIDSEPIFWHDYTAAYVGKLWGINTLFITHPFFPTYSYPFQTDNQPIHLWGWSPNYNQVAVTTTLENDERLELYIVTDPLIYPKVVEADVDIISAVWRPMPSAIQPFGEGISPNPSPVKLSCTP